MALLGFGVVRLGGPMIRKARCDVADAHDAGDVFMCRDPSIAPLLDLRRRLKAMIRNRVSLARSVELSVHWDRILRTWFVYPVTLDDIHDAGGSWSW